MSTSNHSPQALFFHSAHCTNDLQENTAPQVVGLESHAFLRALPVALYLLFPYEDGKLGLEAVGNKQLHRGLKLLKQKPVVPAIGDLPLPLMHILHQLSAFLVAHGESVR